MRRPSIRGLLLSAWAMAGCAPAPPLPVYAAPVRPDAEQTLADLSRVRDLPLEAPVAIERLDDERFLRAFHARDHTAWPKGKRSTAFWSAFTMASASTDVMAMARTLVDQGTDGFYDIHAKRRYVRERATRDVAKSDPLTLAHEEEHSLQDRFFGIPDFEAAYSIAAQGSERAVLWSTAWDDEGAATRFAAALEARRTCARSGAKPPFSVVRDGTHVALVQGLVDDASRAQEGASLLALVGATPPSIPMLGRVKLLARPPIATDFAHGGSTESGRFVDPPLGLTAISPPSGR